MTIHPDAPKVTLYSQPGCGPCIAVARHLDKEGIPFTKVDVREDPNGAARIRELGYTGTPVTVAGDMHWKDYRRDKLDQLKAILEAWEPASSAAE